MDGKPRPRDVIYNSLKTTRLKSKAFQGQKISPPQAPAISHQDPWSVLGWDCALPILTALCLRSYVSQARLLSDLWTSSAKGEHLWRNRDRRRESPCVSPFSFCPSPPWKCPPLHGLCSQQIEPPGEPSSRGPRHHLFLCPSSSSRSPF